MQFGAGGSRQVTLNAAQVYPVSAADAVLVATERVTFGRNGANTPDVPDSVFGALRVFAPTIEQGGVVRAPLGNIVFGADSSFEGPTTDRVNLQAGSLTSVSGAGLALPYGGTSDGVSYTYNGAPVAGAPAYNIFNSGVLRLTGKSVDVSPGAVLDVSGGGNILGAGFVSGRGGSVILAVTPLLLGMQMLMYALLLDIQESPDRPWAPPSQPSTTAPAR